MKYFYLIVITLIIPLLGNVTVEYKLPLYIVAVYELLIVIFLKIKPDKSYYKINFDRRFFVFLFLNIAFLLIIKTIANRNFGFINDGYSLLYIVEFFLMPFVEELIFRYYIFEKLNNISEIRIILISSFLFTLAHWVSRDGLFYVFIHGILISMYYSKEKNILMAYFIHIILNIIGFFII